MDIDLFVPYDDAIHENHQVAQCAGGLIAYWDDPETVPAAEATHMRDDDYIIGTVYKGVARAYPLWVVDYYHIINDTIAEQPVVLASCERCQSGNLFIAHIDGNRRTKFLASGFYNATLMMSERRGFISEKPSQWIHYSGIAITGKYRGKHLAQIPTYHYTWLEWKTLHPETDVMIEPANPSHPDGRQGHGRDEYFSRPGMELGASQTIYGKLDRRYPENQMALGIYAGSTVKAYPLREVKKAGGIVEEVIGGKTIVILAGPRPEQFTMAAFDCMINGETLSFQNDGQYFIDRQTRSKWTVEGQAVAGPYKGQSLNPVNSYYLRWHAWVYVHKHTELYLHPSPLPPYPQLPCPGLEVLPFKPIFDGLATLGVTIAVEMAIPVPALPHQAERGLTIRVDGDRLNLYLFSDLQAAVDYVSFEGAWHYNMIIPRLGRKKACRINNFVVESDPDEQYDDSTQVCRLPDNQIAWSAIVTDPSIIARWSGNFHTGPALISGYFTELINLLKKRRFDVIDIGFLPQCQLYAGAVNGISATIEGCRYAVFRCLDVAHAEKLAAKFSHAVNFAELVFASLPDKMHMYIRHETGLEADDRIDWPDLLKSEKFLKTIQKSKTWC